MLRRVQFTQLNHQNQLSFGNNFQQKMVKALEKVADSRGMDRGYIKENGVEASIKALLRYEGKDEDLFKKGQEVQKMWNDHYSKKLIK